MSSHTKNTNPIRFVVSFVVVLTAAMTLGGVMHSCKNNAGDSTDLKVDISTSSAIIKNFSNDFMANLEGALLAAKVPAADVNSVLEEIRSSVSGLGLADADPNVGGLLQIALNAVKKVLSDAAATLLVGFVAHHTATGSADATVATTVANFTDDHGVDVTQASIDKVIVAIVSNLTGSVAELQTAAAAVTQEQIDDLASQCEVAASSVAAISLTPQAHPPITDIPADMDGTITKCFAVAAMPSFLKNCTPVNKPGASGHGQANIWITCNGVRLQFPINYDREYNCKNDADVSDLYSFLSNAVADLRSVHCPDPNPTNSSAPVGSL